MYIVTWEIPQGSVQGSNLWNAMYNGVFLLPAAKEAMIVSFADDLPVVVAANHPSNVEVYVT